MVPGRPKLLTPELDVGTSSMLQAQRPRYVVFLETDPVPYDASLLQR